MDFEIIETLALRSGAFLNLDRHLARMQAAALHFSRPWPGEALARALQALGQAHAHGDWRVRLALDGAGLVHTQAVVLPPTPAPVRLELAARPMENAVARGPWVAFKTSRRGHYEVFAPTQAGIFDSVLYNEDGEITEATRGNLAMHLDGRWVTPPLACGLLPGVGRALALEQGRLQEQVVLLQDVRRVQAWAFINSLRGWLSASLEPASG
ncbi:aminotransferase class IV [Comamonas composti]|uniref:aminotransferase class IV n=1 Tax=Comamonas composti TaxID=408558 RepID=UPI00040E425F|nr:aminotransferase class IV [Comamonas composti]